MARVYPVEVTVDPRPAWISRCAGNDLIPSVPFCGVSRCPRRARPSVRAGACPVPRRSACARRLRRPRPAPGRRWLPRPVRRPGSGRSAASR
ncbi:hypothetical protein G6F60_015694 [Rhizopus arrhizus]|nr:hypothetical protein G6F60_015694 [Rhizopus arrhizus]